MNKNNKKKAELLGMPYGTACNRLRKQILFKLVCELGQDTCYRCSNKIETVDELSIEHKKAWMQADSPEESFWDLENISFSHLSCNARAGFRHPSKFTKQERLEKIRASDRRYYRNNRKKVLIRKAKDNKRRYNERKLDR